MNAQDNEFRFKYLLNSFFEVFLQQGHPLVICLEDLQWVDQATLQFLKYFIGDIPHKNLLVLATYRENEVDSIHPLALFMNDLAKLSANVEILEVLPLKREAVEELIDEILSLEAKDESDLTDLIFQKTHGNPFFVNQYLRHLYQKKFINFDSLNLKWHINLEGVQDLMVTGNVVEFMSKRAQTLSTETQSLLSVPAAIGQTFDLGILALLTKQTPEKVLLALQDALKEEMIVPQKGIFVFQHDRIQQVLLPTYG